MKSSQNKLSRRSSVEPTPEIMEATKPHQRWGELFMIHRFFGTKLNAVLIFLLLLAIGEFILQCRHITHNEPKPPPR
jgi:hypothetical protein